MAIKTWDQLTLGGGSDRFHSEIVNGTTFEWRCELGSDCDECHEYSLAVWRANHPVIPIRKDNP